MRRKKKTELRRKFYSFLLGPGETVPGFGWVQSAELEEGGKIRVVMWDWIEVEVADE